MLAIGSIVYLLESSQKIMILNRGPIVDENGTKTLYDYSGCYFPDGLNPKEVLYFNQEDIDTIVFYGYTNEDETRFQKLYHDWFRKEGKELQRKTIF